MCYSHPVPDFRSVHVTKTTKSHGDKFEMLGSALTLPNAACPPHSAPNPLIRQTALKAASLLG